MKTLIKAGRTMLGISQAQLCEIAGIPLITLRRIEGKPNHAGLVSEETVARVIAVLEDQGIEFLEQGGVAKGPGVAFRSCMPVDQS
ncbi:helix-turn-helix transcriptional regulator [Ochrobactrum sp. RH2CCR150]|uniref:helix-turn-helix transcriptional regulator n=1 Tax=Ochrobactrum sp. RH2CCR150 TaxID=2587044 RepID=UPI0015F80613|nr:transcriptional regulator with XRE-family HTH domain [Ochrobactrum sp. RH2CCR150]